MKLRFEFFDPDGKLIHVTSTENPDIARELISFDTMEPGEVVEIHCFGDGDPADEHPMSANKDAERKGRSDDPYCAKHGKRFNPRVGCPECLAEIST